MTRISKAVARKLWENNGNFIIVPCKLSPYGLGALDTSCDLSSEDAECRRPFDKLINEFSYYNCNRETGLCPAFYKEG